MITLSRMSSTVSGLPYTALRCVCSARTGLRNVQDVFVELWRHPGRYQPAAGRLRTYLIVLARNRAVDVVRSELRRVARQERHYRLAPAPELAVSDDVKIKTIMQVYEAFGRGDVAGILDAMADDVDWAAEASSAAAPGRALPARPRR